MMATTKLGDVKIRDIKAALKIEEDTLEQIQRIARRQLQRLDVEEEVLQRMLEQLTATQEHSSPVANDSLSLREEETKKEKQQRGSTTRSTKKQTKRMRKK